MTSLAYFSHSYRWQQKQLNRRIWDLLQTSFHFAVDPPGSERLPMDIAQLEVMMQQCACFIGVVPRRPELSKGCSPYQLFENGLAIRAHRSRMLFVDSKLDRGLFGRPPEHYIPFDPDDAWTAAKESDIAEQIETFASEVEMSAHREYDAGLPIGLLLPESDDYAAGAAIERLVRHDLNRTPHWILLSKLRSEHELIGELASCSVVIAEIRRTLMPAEIVGVLQACCVPTVRICRLEDGETKEAASRAMNLSPAHEGTLERADSAFPVIYSGYRVGLEMRPIAFWYDPDDLDEPIRSSLKRIWGKKKVLRERQDATNYFLQLGRVPGQVFISNASELNPSIDALRAALHEQGVETFHYTDPDALQVGDRDYTIALEKEIRESAAFVSLMTRAYIRGSKHCQQELKTAVQRSQLGRLALLPFLIEQDQDLPEHIQMLQAAQLFRAGAPADAMAKHLDFIADSAAKALESSERLKLATSERAALDAALESIPREELDALLEGKLCDAEVPAAEVEALFDSNDGQLALGALTERLIDLARRSFRAANALGRLLIELAHDERCVRSGPGELRRVLVQAVHTRGLLPDIRVRLAKQACFHEAGIRQTSEDHRSGVFHEIENGDRTNDDDVDDDILQEKSYAALVEAMATSDRWGKVLTRTGEALGDTAVFTQLMHRVSELVTGPPSMAREDIGLCLFGDEGGLEIPFEWCSRRGSSEPLCLEHPVRRFLIGTRSDAQLAVRASLIRETPMPMRVLLVGINGEGIRVEDEVDYLVERFRDCYRELGWPTDEPQITVLKTRDATMQRLEDELRRGDYDMLHLAAHGVYENDRPGIMIRPNAGDGAEFCPASTLAMAAGNARIRFAYLACCESASAQAGWSAGKPRRFDNLIQAFVKEGAVPEVLGFLWPIEDTESYRFAKAFYGHFLKDFRTAIAMHAARRDCREDSRLWASPVLYSHCDTADV